MDQKIELRSFPPKIFRLRHGLTSHGWHKLKKEGRLPRQLACGNISLEAERKWIKDEEACAQTAEAVLERQRRHEYFSRLGKRAAASEDHICRISKEERARRKKARAKAKARA
jgi:hypothetical protein